MKRYFNSHTREGVTTMAKTQLPFPTNFNSHTREGVTIKISYYCFLIVKFQLTHP